MSEIYRGVIDDATGDLLRCGYSDFENDGSFDAVNESIRTDVPNYGRRRGQEGLLKMDRWNGSAWIEVNQP